MKTTGKILLQFSPFGKIRRVVLSRFAFLTFLFIFPLILHAQKVSILIPEKTLTANDFAERLAASLAADFKILDNSLSETAYDSVIVEKPYNLTTTEAKNIGTVIGCHYFLLIKSDLQRRISFTEGNYFEAYAAIFAVSARTGYLIFWQIESQNGKTKNEATSKLNGSVEELARQISANVKRAEIEEKSEIHPVDIEEVPAEDTPAAKNFRPPLPFRRVKPKYTPTAYLYDVAATIDVLVDFNEKGEISRTEIIRWAGFGLDESVVETIKKMQWRAAERNNKFIPMRVLLRYNFKKIEKDSN